MTCYECGKSGHYKIDYPSLNKNKNKQEFYQTKVKNAKVRRAYITLEEEDEYSFSSSSILDDHELTYPCLMAHHREKTWRQVIHTGILNLHIINCLKHLGKYMLML